MSPVSPPLVLNDKINCGFNGTITSLGFDFTEAPRLSDLRASARLSDFTSSVNIRMGKSVLLRSLTLKIFKVRKKKSVAVRVGGYFKIER